MATSTNLISGLSSGFDWRSMIDQLIAIESAPVQLKESQKSDYEAQLSEWRSFNTTLLSLKSSAQALSDPDDFFIYFSNMSSDNADVDAEDLLSISSTSSASPGSYSIQVNNIAVAQKLSSSSFSDFSEALGSDYAGDIIINGNVISISETDGLDDIRNKINSANSGSNPTGVTASIITYASNDYRLILTSSETGEDGISLRNGSSNDLLELFGWKDNSESLKNSITGGFQSDAFTSTTQDIKTLLGLSTNQSGDIYIGEQEVNINFATDSLEEIKNKIDELTGISASLVTHDVDGETRYRLQVEGAPLTFSDSQNILETLGVISTGNSDVQGTSSGNTMTSNGENITADTLLSDIDGYLSWDSGDWIEITGDDHDGIPISGSSFTIESSSTVQDLLDAVESAYGGNVTARVTSDGTIEVEDKQTGTSQITVSLSSHITNGALDWGSFGVAGTVRKRELVAGQDASVTIDGVEVTRSNNIIDDVISGVNLTLKDSDAGTTVTLNIERDISAISKKISTFVDAYNEVASYINAQQEYNEEEETTGGVLFGDGTLSSVKSDLSSLLVEPIWGVSKEYSILGLVGINLDNEGLLNIDSEKLNGFLETNFYDVQQLFSAVGSSDSGNIEFISNTGDTEAGEFTVNITQAATRNSSTSDNALSGTLASGETLTVTDGDSIATITLTAGMTISDVINAANTEFDTVYTEILAGATAVEAGSNPVTASTTWDSLDVGGIDDGDIISFSGTNRNGDEVEGSYTIDNAATDTIQGLLSEIESTFGDISVKIDNDGHIIITDDLEGNSSLSISFDYTGTPDIFGTVNTSNTGGHEGRFAMDITASNDGFDHLALTNNSYGSDYSFTIEENNELFWNNSSTPIDVDNGKDVAGTINGESA
ncbi:MAG: flagellar filament capping protein FliD, partial [Desulfobacteraceae bacterium]